VSARGKLVRVLEQARESGLLGPEQIDRQVEHALGFAEVVLGAIGTSSRARRVRLLDLGSGGGLPGLAMLGVPELADVVEELVLLDGSAKRAEWLRRAVVQLDLSGKVRVLEMRAELAGRDPDSRDSFSVVVARSFGKPAVTAECSAPLLAVGGILVVSEPPSGGHSESARWPVDGLATLGMSPAAAHSARGFSYVSLVVREPCPDRFPRRNGVPTKRPLF
jgi:16S rRNA (guanine527-N7)-methyltransferase